MTKVNFVTGSVGDMIQQLASGVGMDNTPGDPTLFAEIAAAVDSVPGMASLSVPDRRAAAAAIMMDLSWGDPNNEEVPGGPHIIRRRAEWVLTSVGRGQLADPKGVSAALHAAADALELTELTGGQL